MQSGGRAGRQNAESMDDKLHLAKTYRAGQRNAFVLSALHVCTCGCLCRAPIWNTGRRVRCHQCPRTTGACMHVAPNRRERSPCRPSLKNPRETLRTCAHSATDYYCTVCRLAYCIGPPLYSDPHISYFL